MKLSKRKKALLRWAYNKAKDWRGMYTFGDEYPAADFNNKLRKIKKIIKRL